MRSTASLLFTTVKRVELEGTKRGAGPLTTGRRLGLVVVRPVALITKATHSQTERERERERLRLWHSPVRFSSSSFIADCIMYSSILRASILRLNAFFSPQLEKPPAFEQKLRYHK